MAITMSSKVSLPKFSLKEFSAPAGPRSPAERLWIVGGVIAAVVVALIGYLVLIAPQRSDTDAVRQQVSDAQAQQAALTSRISVLRSQNKNLPTYLAALKRAQAALPTDSGVPALLRALQSTAAATATSIASTSVGAPVPVTVAAPAAGTAANPTSGATAGSGSAGSGSDASASAPVATPTGAYSMAVTLSVSGTAGNLDQFLVQLQQSQPRAVLITNLTETAGTAGSATSTLSLSMLTFMMPKPGTVPTAAPATAATP